MSLKLLRFGDLAEALSALHHPGARMLGGGSLLLRRTNTGDASIDTLVRLVAPQLHTIEVGAEVRLGSMVTMAQIARHPALEWLAPVARSIGGPAVRNMATVGGNLHAPSPYGDLAVALIALNAVVHVYHRSAQEERLPLEGYLRVRDRLSHTDPTIVTSVSFRAPAPCSFLHKKVCRTHPKGAGVLAIAALLTEEAGVIRTASIAYGGMASAAVRAIAAQQALIGRRRVPEDLRAAIEASLEGTSPADDALASAWYRRAVLPVHLRRLLMGEESAR